MSEANGKRRAALTVAAALLVLWLPACAVAWEVDDGTRPPDTASARAAVAYVDVLSFPVLRLYRALPVHEQEDPPAILGALDLLAFFGGPALDAGLYGWGLVGCYSLLRRAGRPRVQPGAA